MGAPAKKDGKAVEGADIFLGGAIGEGERRGGGLGNMERMGHQGRVEQSPIPVRLATSRLTAGAGLDSLEFRP